MKTFKVTYISRNTITVRDVSAKNQGEALVKTLQEFSPDGIHAPKNCRVVIKPY